MSLHATSVCDAPDAAMPSTSPAPTPGAVSESCFSPDAPPFQSKMHPEFGNNHNPSPQFVERESLASTPGHYESANDYQKSSGREPPADRPLGELGLSETNYYMAMLSREQRAVLRCIRPAVLYPFLLEVAKARGERPGRWLVDECAFCKNNGEAEEFYMSHVLKDSRGRVLCPVLRAFRCPRCGATGERAHTIKYCPLRPGGEGRGARGAAACSAAAAWLRGLGATRVISSGTDERNKHFGTCPFVSLPSII